MTLYRICNGNPFFGRSWRTPYHATTQKLKKTVSACVWGQIGWCLAFWVQKFLTFLGFLFRIFDTAFDDAFLDVAEG